jgi:hypothetical protein
MTDAKYVFVSAVLLCLRRREWNTTDKWIKVYTKMVLLKHKLWWIPAISANCVTYILFYLRLKIALELMWSGSGIVEIMLPQDGVQPRLINR